MEQVKYVENLPSVKDIMTTKPITVDGNTSVGTAWRIMFGADVRHIPVVNNGVLIGIVSDRDIRSFLLPHEDAVINPGIAREKFDASVAEILQSDIITVYEDTPVAEVIDLMIDQKVGAIPVIDPRTEDLVGIVSYIDVLREFKELLA